MRCVYFVSIGLLLINAFFAEAQERFEIGMFGGSAGYLGDLNKSDIFSKEPNPAFGVVGRYNFSNHFAVKVALLSGRLSGKDSHYPDRAFRNFSTTTPLKEITTQLEWHLWPLTEPRFRHQFKASFSPFLFVGFGLALTNPKADLENMLIEKPQFVQGAAIDRTANFNSVNGVVPFGLGLKYRFHPQWTLALEAGVRITFSDYLDGISFAGNPDKTDRYTFSGLIIVYCFKKPPFGFKIRNPTKCDFVQE
ncbi:type IX secretion system protein PorG [Runella slithyformis]|uniref:Thrombospondin type 3 repeat-containing protein n=1 Tax=Runella slithyformis (strain ATCC 29530 / DSM 19594 / LMG 11500 / NCIMB 11436 / LSU 4) TaxID=761193 RepID=A0A7U3ZN79_RUNSL|nr:DUF6089 family protein [Runella slithyformis]AEI50335.1 thrombospondin type 3 repeat-containing protein [Runella slithyformis DSM 19594]